MKDIPVHQLKERGNHGVEIHRYDPDGLKKQGAILGPHRDDHYIFFLVTQGKASLMIDFKRMRLVTNSLYYVLPGQVHHGVANESASGWFIAVDTALVTQDYRDIFENKFTLQQPCLLTQTQMQQYHNLLYLLQQRYEDDETSAFYLPVVHSLMQSFIGMAAACYAQETAQDVKVSRLAQLSQQFKQLLTQHIISQKSPSAYAGMLNVSETYLNESLKKTTGFPVSYWILTEVMLEAKRLLYYSQQNVKQIAHTLGYDDHTYFSRLFKKAERITPLQFRAMYRK
jgi:AraC family transcriptional activator of pobA